MVNTCCVCFDKQDKTQDIKIKELLESSKTIAIVGISRDKESTSNKCGVYLKKHGFIVIPVNPNAERILGSLSMKSLEDIKEPIDIVNVFRPKEEAGQLANSAVKINAKAIWFQEGIISKIAENIAKKNNIFFVQNRCIYKEHKKLCRQKTTAWKQ